MSPICTLNNKFALSPPLLLTHLGILCGVPTIACVIRVVQCPPTCTLKNKCVVGLCGVPPSPALKTSKYFVRCPPSYFSNILVVSSVVRAARIWLRFEPEWTSQTVSGSARQLLDDEPIVQLGLCQVF